jgi:ketosteroid isomerase-like protein
MSAACASAAAGRRHDVRAEVGALGRAYHDAVQRRSAAAVADLYMPGARFMAFPAAPIHGRAAIRRHFVTLFRKAGLCGFSFRSRRIDVGGSLVVDYVGYTTLLCEAGNLVKRISGPGVLVFVRRPHHAAGGVLAVAVRPHHRDPEGRQRCAS